MARRATLEASRANLLPTLPLPVDRRPLSALPPNSCYRSARVGNQAAAVTG